MDEMRPPGLRAARRMRRVAFTLIMLCTTTQLAASASVFHGLGDLDGGDFYSEAHGVSADGLVVVGRAKSTTSGSSYEAFRWTAGTGMVGIGYLSGGVNYSEAGFVKTWYFFDDDRPVTPHKPEAFDSGTGQAFSSTTRCDRRRGTTSAGTPSSSRRSSGNSSCRAFSHPARTRSTSTCRSCT